MRLLSGLATGDASPGALAAAQALSNWRLMFKCGPRRAAVPGCLICFGTYSVHAAWRDRGEELGAAAYSACRALQAREEGAVPPPTHFAYQMREIVEQEIPMIGLQRGTDFLAAFAAPAGAGAPQVCAFHLAPTRHATLSARSPTARARCWTPAGPSTTVRCARTAPQAGRRSVRGLRTAAGAGTVRRRTPHARPARRPRPAMAAACMRRCHMRPLTRPALLVQTSSAAHQAGCACSACPSRCHDSGPRAAGRAGGRDARGRGEAHAVPGARPDSRGGRVGGLLPRVATGDTGALGSVADVRLATPGLLS